MSGIFDTYLREHDLFSLLAPRASRFPYPIAVDRAAWASVPERFSAPILEAAEMRRGEPYPMLLATQFLAFARNGSRKAYEDPYFARRHKLLTAVLAECLRYDGAFLDDIVDGIWCLCEETFWGISAHNGSPHPGARPASERPLPDVENPYIDLFAAQTAALLSWVCHLLGDALDRITPLLTRRVRCEVERRVLSPFFYHDDFWWMGMIRKDVNNWTPWILSNILASLLILERDDRRLAEGFARAMRMLDAYLATLPNDGGCDEGAAYWNMAGGALLDCLELIGWATGGRACFYDEPLIREIGLFPLRAHVQGMYFWNFADCDAKPPLDGERIFTYGRRIGDAALSNLGASIEAERKSPLPSDTPEISRVLNRLFIKMPPPGEPMARPAHVILPDLEVWAMERDGVYAAIKGGHNGESHNHNDVGSLLIYIGGEPALIDIGNMVYTARTFNLLERYALPNTRSRNHNVPMIGVHEQREGSEHRAKDVSLTKQGARMDIAGAYPKEAGVLSLVRALTWDNTLRLSDTVELSYPQPVCWVFMLREKPVIVGGIMRSGRLSMRFDPALFAKVEEMNLNDARIERNFPGSLYRLTLTALPAASHAVVFVFEGVDVHATMG